MSGCGLRSDQFPSSTHFFLSFFFLIVLRFSKYLANASVISRISRISLLFFTVWIICAAACVRLPAELFVYFRCVLLIYISAASVVAVADLADLRTVALGRFTLFAAVGSGRCDANANCTFRVCFAYCAPQLPANVVVVHGTPPIAELPPRRAASCWLGKLARCMLVCCSSVRAFSLSPHCCCLHDLRCICTKKNSLVGNWGASEMKANEKNAFIN